MDMDQKPFYFIGIGGIGMSALAHILLQKKIQVFGSDLKHNQATAQLQQLGATIFAQHDCQQIPQEAVVVYSSSIAPTHVEYLHAQQKHTLLHRSQLLAHLAHNKKSLAVTGTHGKTTIASLLTHVLRTAQLNPSFALGGYYQEHNGFHDQGDYFVLEADESDASFLNYHPYAAIISNIDFDHLDFYGSQEQLIHSFAQFATRVTQHLCYCGDDPYLSALKLSGISYGFKPHNDLVIKEYVANSWMSHISVHYMDQTYSYQLNLIGRHHALNSAAVLGLCLTLGICFEVIQQAFLSFPGVNRRCQRKTIHHVTYIDDYAHHPTEIHRLFPATSL